MKEINFRIIELETHQVLLAKDYDEDDENPTLVITAVLKGCKVTQKFTFEHEAERDLAFDNFTDEQGQKVVDGLLKMFND